jgi:dTDP-glucose pyrophosphorylase
MKIACLEEIALSQGFIDGNTFAHLAVTAPAGAYGSYLKSLLAEIERDSVVHRLQVATR